MTVKPRTRSQDERFLKESRAFGEISSEIFASGDEFALLFFVIILIYIFARALWGLIRTLREAKKPEKTERVSTTPKHYPK